MINITDGATDSPAERAARDSHVLKRVHALNERCLEVLGQLARNESQRTSLVVVDQHRSLYRNLNAIARKRAAAVPFLLVDVHFREATWWRVVSDPRASRRAKIQHRPAFKGKIGAELMRETLTLAWSAVAFGRAGTGLLFGMAPAVCGVIAELRPQDIDRIAARHSNHLQLRWDDFPVFWGRLLSAARDGDGKALRQIQLHGSQLIGSDLLALLDDGFA